MATDLDYYHILNLTPESNVDEIRQQYLRLTMLFHPDRNPGDEARCAEQFRQVKEAYDVLSDDKKRAKFDRTYQEMLAVKAYQAAPKTRPAYATTEDGHTVYKAWRPTGQAPGPASDPRSPQRRSGRSTVVKTIAVFVATGTAVAIGYSLMQSSSPSVPLIPVSSTAVVHLNHAHHASAAVHNAHHGSEMYDHRYGYGRAVSYPEHHGAQTASEERTNRLAEARLNNEFQQPRQDVQ